MPDATMNTPAAAAGLSRRGLLGRAGVFGAAALGTGLLDVGGSRPGNSADASQNLRVTFGPTTGEKAFVVNDNDILTFALNTEYFEAEFYSHAVNGVSLPDSLTTGVQGYGRTANKAAAAGAVTTYSAGPVPFTDPVIQQFAAELAQDEADHVIFLRKALGKHAPARPACDLSTAFTKAMQAAGVIGAADTFDPFASQRNFLLAAYFINDIGPTAYIGASPYLAKPANVAASAGLLGVEAYHAGETRTLIYDLGQTDDALLVQANAIAALRNNTAALSQQNQVTDQGIVLVPGQANVIPTDANSIAFARTFPAILSLFYLNAAVTLSPAPGGFTPSGFNGRIR